MTHGKGYWIEFEKNPKIKDMLIITQGQDFTIDGENVNIIRSND